MPFRNWTSSWHCKGFPFPALYFPASRNFWRKTANNPNAYRGKFINSCIIIMNVFLIKKHWPFSAIYLFISKPQRILPARTRFERGVAWRNKARLLKWLANYYLRISYKSAQSGLFVCFPRQILSHLDSLLQDSLCSPTPHSGSIGKIRKNPDHTGPASKM